MKEIWKPIDGFEGLYEVSNMGNIKRLQKTITDKYRNRNVKEKIMTPRKSKDYLTICLHRDDDSKECRIHRLVAQAFIPNPENKPQVNHKDGNKQNNCVDNLEWNTQSENMKHAYKLGLKKSSTKGKFGTLNATSKKVGQYDLNGKFIKEWDCIQEVKRKLGLNSGNISSCCHGKRNHVGGYKWVLLNEVSYGK